MSSQTDIIKVLFVDTEREPIYTERLDLTNENPAQNKATIIERLNELGKNSHCLLKFNDKFFVYDHTAKRGASSDVHRSIVKYHPLMAQLV
jgi:hypothetical protein